MHFTLAVTTLVAAVTAAPGANVTVASKMATMSVADADEQCGSNYQIYCCNELAGKDKKPQDMTSAMAPGQTPKPGLLDGLLGAVVGPDGLLSHLLGQCSRIDVAVPGAADTLSSQCRARAACCRDTPSVAYGGLINVALPCIALDSIVG
ncbi:hypothetical protein LMH87_010313 [Akanthomyces muscarius]|uniref:Hydrophobin n=1 Tax=Akanthomyces muscarius TaxID=2231603 RepID=A0A9W8QD21_AKAMU|nr:hypothetical protein LMH87_010313 [Akanthomyces muscarius]KAJ4153843.1 hypothetical protein LMH87_010313 [Akanthomyces muscarius]